MSERNFILRIEPLGEFRTARACGLCLQPATREVYRLPIKKVVARRKRFPRAAIDLRSLRFACNDHTSEELFDLWKGFARPAMPPLPDRRGRDIFKGNLSEFYSGILRNLGGEVPMPTVEEKTEPREKVWLPPSPLPAPRMPGGYGIAPRGYTVRLSKPPRGNSGRKWKKQVKAMRRAVKAHL